MQVLHWRIRHVTRAEYARSTRKRPRDATVHIANKVFHKPHGANFMVIPGRTQTGSSFKRQTLLSDDGTLSCRLMDACYKASGYHPLKQDLRLTPASTWVGTILALVQRQWFSPHDNDQLSRATETVCRFIVSVKPNNQISTPPQMVRRDFHTIYPSQVPRQNTKRSCQIFYSNYRNLPKPPR